MSTLRGGGHEDALWLLAGSGRHMCCGCSVYPHTVSEPGGPQTLYWQGPLPLMQWSTASQLWWLQAVFEAWFCHFRFSLRPLPFFASLPSLLLFSTLTPKGFISILTFSKTPLPEAHILSSRVP